MLQSITRPAGEEEFDVAIIGYGPTGAVLAHLLGLCGVRTLVLEREGAHYHLPRAVHFDGEVMRVFQWIGVADKIEPLTARHPGMRFVDPRGRLLLDWPRPQETGAQGWRSNYRFHQPDLERLLREGMSARPQVTVRNRSEVFLVEDRGSHVHLRYEDMARGRIHRVRAQYAVGCDGARSLVRRFIESPMEDYGFHERWLVIDALLKRDMPELGDHSVQYCDPARPATYVRGPFNRRRWEITVLPEEDATRIATPAEVWKLLSRWIAPEDAELERTAVYVFHSLVAGCWRQGRLFIAGDAAHQTPPFMGQGMCAGIRDAANLGWKLALACRGVGGEALLDSYQSERKPNAAEYIATAVRLGGLINTAGTEAALRAAMPQPDGGSKMESIHPPLGPGLGGGPHAGRLFGQPALADGRLMDDAVGHRFVLVADAALAAGVRPPDGVALVTTAGAPDVARHLARFETRAALLRPDRFVHGTAETPETLAALLNQVLPSPLSTTTPELV
ncbi:MAG: bifunctional 3-(3-hydroxy-phenyl)propionate/3-hydroxycinnamic acid hydroxylase [Pseudochelatococcus sp.]|jgi:3-(3-hydroxy-phenyl)propionate hydroxylase|uniref:bifunctional 3-(3-hydroxy-phenyl)propionate/3-hydroxycinnamic acid hydroxylase MhpA n=1 Tax=Pseudochelatococcus sp. TaxID=2020869 RepID=UPI003D8D0AA0